MAAASLPNLNTLLQRANLDDHVDILKACDAALKKNKSDTDAQHVKAVALLKLDRYDDAERLFEQAGDALKSKAKLEFAYALYKSGKLHDAAKIASELEGQRGARHVEAQSTYRAEDFTRTIKLYQELTSSGPASENHDLRVNSGAVDAQLQWIGQPDLVQSKRPGREDLEAFETTYNAACGSIARGELGQAEVLLKRAKELCKHSEDLGPAEKSAELLPIAVQQLYVAEVLDKVQEADSLAADIEVNNLSDHSTKKIAQSNLLIASLMPPNPFLNHKIFNSNSAIPESDKLFSFQSRALTANATTIDLQAFKFDGVAASTARTISKNSSATSPDVTTLSVLNAAAHARNQIGQAALKQVLPELEQRPYDVGLIATIVQMYLLTGNTTSATTLLESFLHRLEGSTADSDREVRYSPGLLAMLTAIYRSQGRKSQIKQELAKAAVYWRRKSKAPQSLLQAAGVSLLSASSTKEDRSAATDIFSKLREQNAEDKAAVAGLVASNATKAMPQAHTEADQLTAVSDLVKGIDVAKLEAAGIPQSSNALAIAQKQNSKKRKADGDQSKPKRVRKSRLPKDYDPAVNPDSERWLPLRDRSNYRPKGKKKGKKAGEDRTQGGIVADDVGVKPTAATTVIAPSAGGANKKKKGKGKK